MDGEKSDVVIVVTKFVGKVAMANESTQVHLVDTKQQSGLVKTSLESLPLARNEKGPMSSKDLTYTIKKEVVSKFKDVITKAIKNNAFDYINPSIKNLSYKGVKKQV